MINVDELKQVLDLACGRDLSEFELEAEGFKLRIRRAGAVAPPPVQVPQAAPAAPVSAAALQPAAQPPADTETDADLVIVTSPIVGTFYRAPEPDAPPFVRPGDHVRPGQTLCIIEAMKMMNTIDSEYEGTVVKVFVENGQPVQYGERLFAIRR